jgi:hypothetical protein
MSRAFVARGLEHPISNVQNDHGMGSVCTCNQVTLPMPALFLAEAQRQPADVGGPAKANSTVNVLDGTTLLGTTTASSSGAWAFETNALSDGARSFTAIDTDATEAPMGAMVVPNITSFSDANGSRFTVDGQSVEAENANQPWSLT